MNTFIVIILERLDLDGNNSLKYVPGKARSHHLETMMSKEELEEEQRSVPGCKLVFLAAEKTKFIGQFSWNEGLFTLRFSFCSV